MFPKIQDKIMTDGYYRRKLGGGGGGLLPFKFETATKEYQEYENRLAWSSYYPKSEEMFAVTRKEYIPSMMGVIPKFTRPNEILRQAQIRGHIAFNKMAGSKLKYSKLQKESAEIEEDAKQYYIDMRKKLKHVKKEKEQWNEKIIKLAEERNEAFKENEELIRERETAHKHFAEERKQYQEKEEESKKFLSKVIDVREYHQQIGGSVKELTEIRYPYKVSFFEEGHKTPRQIYIGNKEKMGNALLSLTKQNIKAYGLNKLTPKEITGIQDIRTKPTKDFTEIFTSRGFIPPMLEEHGKARHAKNEFVNVGRMRNKFNPEGEEYVFFKTPVKIETDVENLFFKFTKK
jgi:hypothetical protein